MATFILVPRIFKMEKIITYLFVALIYTIAYIYSIIFAPKLAGAYQGWAKTLNDTHESCLLGCQANLCKLSVRGDNYYINAGPNKTADGCMVTFWGFSHFFLYSVLGFLFPDVFWETFFIGVAFEIYEYKKFNCHDTFDIILNTVGFLVGKNLRFLIKS